MLKLFTLTNGLEIIGRVSKIDDELKCFDIDQPLGICTQPTGPDTYGLAFRPYSVAHPEGTHRFFWNALFSETYNIPDEIEKAYIKCTSKIQLL